MNGSGRPYLQEGELGDIFYRGYILQEGEPGDIFYKRGSQGIYSTRGGARGYILQHTQTSNLMVIFYRSYYLLT